MATHRGAIYTVQVHRRYHPDDQRRLGNIDRMGTSLAALLNGYLTSMGTVCNDDQTRSVVCEKTSRVTADRIESRFAQGQTGIVADIHNARGQFRIQQAFDDNHLVRCASLISLPSAQRLGFWAVHINSGRTVKGLIAPELLKRFRSDFPGLMLKINPAVPKDVFRRAVDDGKIAEITLRRYERPYDREDAAVDDWVDKGAYARTEVRISGIKDNRLLPGKLKRFLNDRKGALEDILEFEGMQFEEARVKVEQADGQRRSFNISALESGHPFTQDLRDLRRVKGEPTQKSLIAGLQAVLDEMT